jgi:hypothetical protein
MRPRAKLRLGLWYVIQCHLDLIFTLFSTFGVG